MCDSAQEFFLAALQFHRVDWIISCLASCVKLERMAGWTGVSVRPTNAWVIHPQIPAAVFETPESNDREVVFRIPLMECTTIIMLLRFLQ